MLNDSDDSYTEPKTNPSLFPIDKSYYTDISFSQNNKKRDFFAYGHIILISKLNTYSTCKHICENIHTNNFNKIQSE